MFEKFTGPARAAVFAAYERANGAGASRIEPIHLLGGILVSGGPGAAALAASGIEPDRLAAAEAGDATGALDEDALASVGIDLDAVRESVEKSFGEGALDAPIPRSGRGRLPMSRTARSVFGNALRDARRGRHGRLDTGHLLLGVLDVDDQVVRGVLNRSGADADDLRADVLRRIESGAL